MTHEENIQLAARLADAILRLDAHSAQLRLIHSGALRAGEFDLARLQVIRGHLADIQNITEHAIPLANLLEPSISIETAYRTRTPDIETAEPAEKEIEK